MAIVDTDGIAEEHDHSDNCPGHPRGELRFAVRYSEYSSGEEGYWRDFRAALLVYYEHWKPDFAPWRSKERTAATFVETYTYRALRRRVFDLTVVIAVAAEITGRNMATWLVKARGFDWRADCGPDQLRALIGFLETPGVIELARQAPDYPDRRDALPARHWLRHETDPMAEPWTLAQIHDVFLRHAGGELTLNEAVRMLGPTFDAADADRAELQEDASSPDAWHMLSDDRANVLGEPLYQAFMAALRRRT